MSDLAAQYKKKDGAVSVAADGKKVTWTPSGASEPALSIAIGDIANLQQTPATSAKASIKIIVNEPSAQAGNHTLTFTSTVARDDQQHITRLLRQHIEAFKTQNVAALVPAASAATPTDSAAGASAAMVMAQTITAEAKDNDDQYADATLLKALELQMSLLNSSPALRQRFDRALQEKPDSVSLGQFSHQFWSTRVHMLRSHAIERSQTTGTYNVLSVIKAKAVDGALMLSLTKEQIELLFRQHPIVQKAYNENVPQLSESDFWERFFHSRLMKKLKGERITDKDVLDPKLDKYLTYDERVGPEHDLIASSIPNFINIEGNENNHSQRKGNRPDFTMNPANFEKAPILRVLNRMSEKMMKEVPNSDTSRHAPVGLDEETYKELQLRDLQRADDDNRVILKIQDQSRFFSAGQSVQASASAALYTQKTPAQVLSILRNDLKHLGVKSKGAVKINIHSAIKVNDDSSSDEENSAPKKMCVGSRASRRTAMLQTISAIKKQALHGDDYACSKAIPNSELASKLGVMETILDSLTMTHNTTVEFLHYFWAVFYSGDSDRANEVAKLLETLDKSLDRITAVTNAAEAEHRARLEKLHRENEYANQRAVRKRKFDPESVKGGAQAINQIVEPLLRAINAARSQYQKTLQEQMGQAGSQ